MKLFEVYPRFDITLTKAKGVYVYDDKQIKYLDLYGGHGVISIGHNHRNYIDKLEQQLHGIGFYSNSVQIPIQEELAMHLAEQSGYPDYALFLCNSGSEANENALKLASFHAGKKKVIAFKGSFHGRTAASLNITDNKTISAPININNFDVEFVELNNKEALTAAIKQKDVCAVIIEGIQGVGGLNMATNDYYNFLADSCKKYEALLILDEIQSGYGRTGQFFAHQNASIKADIITMAKGMGNGFPIGGLLINPIIESSFGLLGTTFGGNHLACAAGISVLQTIRDENILENLRQVSKYLRDELESISAIKIVKGRGLMLGLTFDFPIKELRLKLLNQYQIFTGASVDPNLLRILPPLNITKEALKPFIQALKELLI